MHHEVKNNVSAFIDSRVYFLNNNNKKPLCFVMFFFPLKIFLNINQELMEKDLQKRLGLHHLLTSGSSTTVVSNSIPGGLQLCRVSLQITPVWKFLVIMNILISWIRCV